MAKTRSPKLIDPHNLSAAQLAECFGVTPQAVGLWKKAGCPCDGNKFDLPTVIRWRAERDRPDTATEAELRAVRLAREKLKLDAERASLVPAEDVRNEVTRLCNVIREHARELTDEISLKLGLGREQQAVVDAARKAYLERCATDMEAGTGAN